MKIITVILFSLLLSNTHIEAHPLNSRNKAALSRIIYSALATELGLLSLASASVSKHCNNEWAPIFKYGAYGFGIAASASALAALTNYYDLSTHLHLHKSNHSFPLSEN
jgi:hypothetical protein